MADNGMGPVIFTVPINVPTAGKCWLGVDNQLVDDEEQAVRFTLAVELDMRQRLKVRRELHEFVGGLDAWTEITTTARSLGSQLRKVFIAELWPDGRPKTVEEGEEARKAATAKKPAPQWAKAKLTETDVDQERRIQEKWAADESELMEQWADLAEMQAMYTFINEWPHRTQNTPAGWEAIGTRKGVTEPMLRAIRKAFYGAAEEQLAGKTQPSTP